MSIFTKIKKIHEIVEIIQIIYYNKLCDLHNVLTKITIYIENCCEKGGDYYERRKV